MLIIIRPDDTNGKMSASVSGGMRFKSLADQIYQIYSLPTTRYRC